MDSVPSLPKEAHGQGLPVRELDPHQLSHRGTACGTLERG